MSETSDRALDLADQWAKAIGQKLTDAAPGAYDVAVEAVKVKIGSEILSWISFLVGFLIVASIARFMWSKFAIANSDYECRRKDEEVPWFIGGIISTLVGAGMLVGVMSRFPSREIVGMFAPRGYVALMLLDSVQSKR